jgi:hypothetical protein
VQSKCQRILINRCIFSHEKLLSNSNATVGAASLLLDDFALLPTTVLNERDLQKKIFTYDVVASCDFGSSNRSAMLKYTNRIDRSSISIFDCDSTLPPSASTSLSLSSASLLLAPFAACVGACNATKQKRIESRSYQPKGKLYVSNRIQLR